MKDKIELNTERMKGVGIGPPEGFQANLLFGLDDLCRQFINKATTVLEIGAHLGVSTSLLCYYAKTVDAVDIKLPRELLDLQKGFDNLILHKQNSVEYMEQAINQNKKYDLIYLDGDHSYAGVKKDIILAQQLLTPSGVISGHDMVEGNFRKKNGVLKAVYELYPCIQTGESRLHRFSDSSWCITRMKNI